MAEVEVTMKKLVWMCERCEQLEKQTSFSAFSQVHNFLLLLLFYK